MVPVRRDVDLIIFDCDGVVVDSELLSCSCLCAVLADHGINLDIDEALRLFLGRSTESVIEHCRAAGRPVSPDFMERLSLRIREEFRAALKPIVGMGHVLENLDLPYCIASSSDLDRVSFALERTDLSRFFRDRIFTSQMVQRGKPAPDLFLHAAKEMGCSPERTLVVEDSPSGVEAAKAAGMRVWGFLGGAHQSGADADRLLDAGAERIFHRMSEFFDELKRGHVVVR